MHRSAVLRVFSTMFLIVTMLGANQSFAQGEVPQATPVSKPMGTGPAEPPAENGSTSLDSQPPGGTPESTAPSEAGTRRAVRTNSISSDIYITISGQVTNDSGTPLFGAVVCYEGRQCSSTGDGGFYSIEDVGDGNGWISARMDGHWGNGAYLGNPGMDATFNFTLEVINFHTVSGQITDEDGAPLPNVLACIGVQATLPTNCTRTTTDGYYSLPSTEMGRILSMDPAWVFASGDLWPIEGDITVNLTASPRESQSPAQTSTLFGTVEDRNGNPVDQFTICYDAGGKGGRYCEISNSESNEFELVFGTGSVILNSFTVTAADCPTHDTGMFDELFGPGTHDLGTFMLDCEVGREQTFTISGRVTFRDETPYSNGSVPFWHDTLTNGITDDDGYYTITDVPNGNYQIGGAFGPGFGSDLYDVTVEDGDVQQNLIVAIAPTLGGEITDTDGKPISAEVCFAERCTTAENGRYQMVANMDEEIIVTVSHNGYVTQSKTVTNDGPTAHHDLSFFLEQVDEGGNGDELPYDPDEVIAACFFSRRTGLEEANVLPMSHLVYEGWVIVSMDGTISPNDSNEWVGIYLGDCSGKSIGQPGFQIIENPDTILTYCLDGVTNTGRAGSIAPDAITLSSGRVPPFLSQWIFDWNETPEGITSGPCEDDSGDNGDGNGDNGNGQNGDGNGDNGNGQNGDGNGDNGNGQNGDGNGDNSNGQNGDGNGDNGNGQNGDANGDNGNGQNGDGNGDIGNGQNDDSNGDNGNGQNGDGNGDNGNGQNGDANGNGNGQVTSLPETGTGTGSASITLWLATAASVMMTAGAILIRQKRA